MRKNRISVWFPLASGDAGKSGDHQAAPPPDSGFSFSLENSRSYAEWLAGISSPGNRLRMVQRGQDVPRVLVPYQRGLRMGKREKREAGDLR